jgi:hypothetical protein
MIIKKGLPPPPIHPQSQAARANDLPPPYIASPNNGIPSSSASEFVATPFHTPSRDRDVQEFNIHCVNQIHINNRHEDVIGTYCIDASLPVNGKLKGKSWKRPKGPSITVPNASFRSRHGAISINLATKGAAADNTKAHIQAATRKGDIDINLYSLCKGKHIALDVNTRKGNILVHIPKNFCGAIQLRSRKKGCRVLPALASNSRILTIKDNEVLLLIGDPSAVTTSGMTDDVSTDFCQLASRSGKVTVGFTGENDCVPEVGIWKKLGEYLWGGSS